MAIVTFNGLEYQIFQQPSNEPNYVNNIHNQYFKNFSITKIREDLPFAMLIGIADDYFVETPRPLTIPEYVHGYPVKAIGVQALMKSIYTEIFLPETMRYICSQAFKDCVYLTEIHFPDELWGIDSEIC